MYPEKEDYFASLLDASSPYKPEWLVKRYNKQVQTFQITVGEKCFSIRFRFMKEFDEMPREDKRRLTIEFEELRPSAYHFALSAEVNS